MQILGHNRGAILTLAERLRDCNVRLRWGGDIVPDAVNGKAHLHDGLEQLKAFRDAGVPTVEFTTDPQVRDQWVAGRSIVLGRALHHTQGRDIVVPGISQKKNIAWNRRDFWTLYKGSYQEWRVHVVNDLSIARGLKTFTGRDENDKLVTPEVSRLIIRSRRLGWTMRHDVEPPKGLRDLAKQAVKAVGYDLGAVDILQVYKDKAPDGAYKFLVLEVNSRPAIRDEYTLTAYEKALRKLA